MEKGQRWYLAGGLSYGKSGFEAEARGVIPSSTATGWIVGNFVWAYPEILKFERGTPRYIGEGDGLKKASKECLTALLDIEPDKRNGSLVPVNRIPEGYQVWNFGLLWMDEIRMREWIKVMQAVKWLAGESS